MALPNVATLIHQAMAEHYPDSTIAQVERRLRTRKNYIQQWCDEGMTLKLPPQHETIYALARILNVKTGDLYTAFLRDSTGLDDEDATLWKSGLTSQEHELLDLYHQTPPGQRHMLMGVLRLFAGGFPPCPSEPSGALSNGDGNGNGSPPHPPRGPAPAYVRSNDGASQSATASHPDAVAS